jgi:8-oxo-dGTP diphosphatase
MLASLSILSVLGFSLSLVLGAVLGVAADHLLSPGLARWRERRSEERALGHRRLFDYAGRPFEFDGVDVGLQVLFGTLGRALGPEDVHSTLLPRTWTAPAELREPAAAYAQRSGFFDGGVARLHGLDVTTFTDLDGAEHHRVRLAVMRTGYYDMLATNVALGPFTPEAAPLLAGRGGLAVTQLSNMMGLDLTLVTEDGYVPVFLRSAGMAALDRCWQASSGETVQLPIDGGTDGGPDVFKTARRGLEEELGISPEQVQELAITAFVATPEYANVGVLMVATMPVTAEAFEANLNRHVLSARDNWEYSAHDMIAIDDVGQLAAALTDPERRWSKQAVASLVFAHALRSGGDVEPLAAAIHAAGELRLEAGSVHREVLETPAEASRYCWRCGAALLRAPPATCPACGQEHYRNPKPCGEAVVLRDDGHVLLLRRANPPWQACWDVPGGFCEGAEHPLAAARRELEEELGLSAEAVASLGTWMDTYGPPAADGVQEHTANSAYVMRPVAPEAGLTLQASEVLEAGWFPLDALPEELAFPAHIGPVLRLAAVWARDPGALPALPDAVSIAERGGG